MARSNKADIWDIIFIAILLLCIVIALLTFIFSGIPRDIGAQSVYDCDVQSLNLNTKIEISKGDELLYTVSGDVFRIVEDPLTMYRDEKAIAYAGDSYNIVNQDSHSIHCSTTGEEFEVAGEFELFGNEYSIYSGNQLIATAEFNWLNTRGELKDTSGNLIADYTSRYGFNDYIVQIKENDLISDESLLMIFASYYSDEKYDES